MYSRLHSYPRSGPGAYSGSQRSRQRLLQPGDRRRFQRPRSDRIVPQNHWTKNRDDRKTTQTRRPAPAHRVLKKNQERTWLETGVPIARRHYRERLEMASKVSKGLPRIKAANNAVE